MKHIKTPVTPGKSTATLWEGHDILCVVGGKADSYKKADEIMLALNEHDKLVAERDALVKACEANVELHIHASECTECDIDGQCSEGERLLKRALDLRDAALALVRGEEPNA